MSNIKLENAINDKGLNINKSALLTFILSLVIGLFGHSVAINNLILNWDSLHISSDSLFLVMQGKWFWPIATKITGSYLIPSLQRPLAIFFIAICSYITVIIFDVKNYFLSGSIGIIWILFPSVSSIFLYPFANTFVLAMLLNMISCLLLLKYNKWISSFVFCVLGLGIYAAYIGMFITLLIYSLMLMLLNGKSGNEVLKKGLKYLGFVLLACLSYFIVLKLVIKIGNLQLSNYRGINNIGNFNIYSYIKAMIFSVLATLAFFSVDIFGGYNVVQIIMNYIFLIFLIFLFIKILKFRKLQKSQLLLLILFILLLPLSYHAIGILGKNPYTHWIMKYPFVAYYFFLPILISYAQENNIYKMKNYHIYVILILILTYHWFSVAQESYFNNLIITDSINSDCQIIIDRITQLDEFDFETPIYVTGTNNEYSNSSINDSQINAHTGVVSNTNAFFHLETQVISYINDFYSYNFIQANNEQIEKLKYSYEIKKMPKFPLKESIKIIDGIVVVNYGDIK